MTLQVYGQPYEHSDCYILGTREDLVSLANQILASCSSGSSSGDYFTSDGEGYSIKVAMLTDSELDNTRLPYHSEMSEDHRKTVKNAWQHFVVESCPD